MKILREIVAAAAVVVITGSVDSIRGAPVGGKQVEVGDPASADLIPVPTSGLPFGILGPSSLSTGFEPAEGFGPGWIGGQVGWTTFASSTTEAHVETANPEAGVQHLRISKETTLPEGEYVGAFSPDLGPLPAVTSTVSLDVAISALGGADYHVVPQSPSQGYKSAWVTFVWTDDIIVVDDLGNGPEWVDTGADWTAGPYAEFRIELNPFAGKIKYYYAGNLIYTGTVWAGTNVEQVAIFSDNCNNTDVGDLDNLDFGPSDTSLLLVADQPCYTENDTATVDVELAKAMDMVVGGQFFLSYDNTVLDFLSAEVGDPPFTLEVYEDVDEGAGTIDYAVGVPENGPGTMDDTTMATITFGLVPGAEVCPPVADLVAFRAHDPPTLLTDDLGVPITPNLYDLNAISVDQEPPEVSNCPADILDHPADANECFADVAWPAPDVSDNCDSDPAIVYEIDLDDDSVIDDTTSVTTYTFPVGNHRVLVVATDACGNKNTDCDFAVTVSDVNELVIDIELQPVVTTLLERCITFELRGVAPTPDAVVSDEVTFTDGLATGVVIEVPCGEYDCLLVGDSLHTLKREAVDFGVSGTQYIAGVVDENPMEPWETGWDPLLDHSLLGGNLNGDLYDGYVDTLDFGIYIAEYGKFYDSDGDSVPDGHTPCDMFVIHADVTGDGLVSTADFTFIHANFLRQNEVCDNPSFPVTAPSIDSGVGPITRISVGELIRSGMEDLIVADLNGDGWLDENDITAFINGARPNQRGR
ncbi:MAG: HYR domain-containing protein [Phycisphaerales bacterium]|nr:MAG: HYR domain-containing protein [Phycisphaerales bacterium]